MFVILIEAAVIFQYYFCFENITIKKIFYDYAKVVECMCYRPVMSTCIPSFLFWCVSSSKSAYSSSLKMYNSMVNSTGQI